VKRLIEKREMSGEVYFRAFPVILDGDYLMER
jgi:hypothetical protein